MTAPALSELELSHLGIDETVRADCRARRPGKWLDRALEQLMASHLLEDLGSDELGDIHYRVRARRQTGELVLRALFSPATARSLAPIWAAIITHARGRPTFTMGGLLADVYG